MLAEAATQTKTAAAARGQARETPVEALLPPDEVLFGRTAAMQQVRGLAERMATTGLPALLSGESGTGKDVMARWLHEHSRAEGSAARFIRVNCPALPASLVESELFGHEVGAFTGAGQARAGWVEQAAGGTLFLDEIGDFALELQAKLLELLQEGQFARLGAEDTRQLRAWVVCATHRDLAEEVERGRFRADLYYRISTVTLLLPPLRERREDIPALVAYFLGIYEQRYQRTAPRLSSGARAALGSFSWPGNIRQLQNVMKRLVILGEEAVIEAEMARPPASAPGRERAEDLADGGAGRGSGELGLKAMTRAVVEQLERKVIARALREHNWNRRRVSQALHISYRALLYKIKKFNLPAKRTVAPGAGRGR